MEGLQTRIKQIERQIILSCRGKLDPRQGTATSTLFWTSSRAVLNSDPRPHALWAVVYSVPHGDRRLIGAWNPML